MKKCLLWTKLSISKTIEFIHVHPRKLLRINPALVMVWWGVSYDGITSLHFCEKGIKTAVKNYQRVILANVVESLNQTMFQNRPWIFQQDSAPVHKAKTTQQ
jgi:hypothetical protein